MIQVMNICFVYKDYPILDNPKHSGIGNYIYQLSQKLSHRHSVAILTQTKKNTVLKQQKVTIHSLQRLEFPLMRKRSLFLISYNLRIAWNLLRLNQKYHFKVVEFANWQVEGLLFALICWLFRLPIKIVCRLHTSTYDADLCEHEIRFSTGFVHWLERLFTNLPNVYLTTSTKNHAQHCRKLYRLCNKSISIIPLGIFMPRSKSKNQLVPLSKNGLNVVSIGRLENRKGIDILIKAIPLILNKMPQTNFYIIGNLSSSFDFFAAVHQFIPLKYIAQLHYLGYIDAPKRLDYFYQSADIFVFPSLYESFGLTLLEAMSYKKAVISTRAGGIPEIIIDNINGLLIPAKSHKSLAFAICKLLDNQKLRTRLGKAAYLTVKHKFSINHLCQKTEEFYLK